MEYGKAISQAAQNPCGQFYRQLKTLGKVFNVKSSGQSFEEKLLKEKMARRDSRSNFFWESWQGKKLCETFYLSEVLLGTSHKATIL
jgi:hypothetical protein